MADWKDRIPNFGGTLGTLVRTAMEQVDQLRGAAIREAGVQRTRLDVVLLRRKRRDAAAQLGDRVYELSLTSLSHVGSDPEVASLLDEIELLDGQIEDASLAPMGDDMDYEAWSSEDGPIDYPSASTDDAVWRPNVNDIPDADVIKFKNDQDTEDE